MRALVAVIALSTSTAYAQPARATLTPAEQVAKIEATYKTATSVTASFTKSVENATFGGTTTTQGTLAVARPGKMQWQFFDKKKKRGNEFLFDGKTGWMVDHKGQKAIPHAMSTSDLPAVVAFLAGTGSLAKEFTIGAPSDPKQLVPGASVLQLTPKAASASYKNVLLVVDPTTWTVQRSVVTSPEGDVTTYAFTDVNLAAKLDAKVFAFDPKQYPLYVVEQPPAPAPRAPAPPTKPVVPATKGPTPPTPPT